MFHIVLVEPEIPPNTGNISRTCAVTGTALHMVRPFGFSLDDKYLKRAGLDYWNSLEVYYYDAFEEVEAAYPDARFFLTSTHATRSYGDVKYQDGDFLVFGKERPPGWARPSCSAGKGCHPHPHAPGPALPEPIQLRGHRAVRGPTADGIPRLGLTLGRPAPGLGKKVGFPGKKPWISACLGLTGRNYLGRISLVCSLGSVFAATAPEATYLPMDATRFYYHYCF